MIEKYLMVHVGSILEQSVITVNRKTTANNTVYKTILESRPKVEIFLRLILPYVYGEKTKAVAQKLKNFYVFVTNIMNGTI